MLRSFYRVAAGSIVVALFSACAAPVPGRDVAALPRIVAHRGGTGDAPENTLEAIRQSVAHHADAMWLTVQLSRDGVPVLYRPADLSALTDASGPVSTRTAAELAQVNAGWMFRSRDAKGNDDYPYRRAPVGVPTLREALRAIPVGMLVILDMKALPAAPQAQAVAQVLTEENAWSRVVIYSTESAYQQSFAAYPQATVFEPRDETRTRLLRVLLNEGCFNAPGKDTWTAFELHRPLTVTEKFTLGEGISKVNATMWSGSTVACFRQRPGVRIVVIAVNSAEDYRAAACLGIDAVLADSPAQMERVRAGIDAAGECPAISRGQQQGGFTSSR
ncbi:glycerophosphodiester phosphodiesterase family protein [Paraburkholderia sp. GAS334]|uniref:glycerophosphodiester phosphodiesterase family protein n=1 Tax=Paraburkholderia sp. GAS334 TaxID=3035131 RepID=UPI003D1A1C1F